MTHPLAESLTKPSEKHPIRHALSDWYTRVILSLVLIPFLVGGWWLWEDLNREWAPLGPYPTQDILNVQPIPVGEKIKVAGKKCAEDDTPINGSLSWVSISPGGVIVPGETGSNLRAPTKKEAIEKLEGSGATIVVDPATGRRCVIQVFKNDLPEEVRERSLQWLREDISPVWIISGVETPSDGNKTGVPLTWSTEPFELTDPDPSS